MVIERARECRAWRSARCGTGGLLVGGHFVRLDPEAGAMASPARTSSRWSPHPAAGPRDRHQSLRVQAPTRRHPPVVLDIATTVVSMQKVRVTATQGEPMDEGSSSTPRGGPPRTPPRSSRTARWRRSGARTRRQGLRPGAARRCPERVLSARTSPGASRPARPGASSGPSTSRRSCRGTVRGAHGRPDRPGS